MHAYTGENGPLGAELIKLFFRSQSLSSRRHQ